MRKTTRLVIVRALPLLPQHTQSDAKGRVGGIVPRDYPFLSPIWIRIGSHRIAVLRTWLSWSSGAACFDRQVWANRQLSSWFQQLSH